MQTRQAHSSKPHKRNSGSFTPSTSASFTSNSGSFAKSNSGSFKKVDSVPLAENPYARSSSAIYTGGERAIFRNQEVARRNGVILRAMIALCLLMIAVIIGFALGKGSTLAEANTTTPQQVSTPVVQTVENGETPEPSQV
ncbi:MAG: hypothetical protein RR547_02815 [Raoultibacter sp.]